MHVDAQNKTLILMRTNILTSSIIQALVSRKHMKNWQWHWILPNNALALEILTAQEWNSLSRTKAWFSNKTKQQQKLYFSVANNSETSCYGQHHGHKLFIIFCSNITKLKGQIQNNLARNSNMLPHNKLSLDGEM